MSLSESTNRWLNRLYKSIAIFLVCFAVLISALRLFLPYAHNYRIHYQNFINDTYQTNIVIGSLTMGWEKLGPSLVAKNVSMIDTDELDIFIEKIEIKADFWRSIRQLEFVSQDFSINGAKILIDNAALTSANTTTKSNANNVAAFAGISNLFLKQIKYFSLKDSTLQINHLGVSHKFLLSKLHWLNKGERHFADGKVIVDGLSSNTLSLKLDLKGNVFNRVEGDVFFAANNINITPWLDRVLAINNEDTNSSINFDAWLSVKNGQMDKLQLALRDNQISWVEAGQEHLFSIKNAHIFSRLNNGVFNIYSSPFTLQTDDFTSPEMYFDVSSYAAGIDGYLSTVSIESLLKLTPLLNTDQALGRMLKELSPNGAVDNLFFRLPKGQTAKLQNTANEKPSSSIDIVADVTDISTQFSHNIPGLSKLTARISYTQNYLHTLFDASDGELDFGKHFKQSIPYGSIKGNVGVYLGNQNIEVDVKELIFRSEQLSLVANAHIDIPEEAPVSMALLAKINNVQVTDLHYLYPHLLMGDDLVSYLNNGLVTGVIPHATVLYHGNFSDFPFTDHSGIFVVDAQLNEAKYTFDTEWPSIESFNANLNFTNNGMLITAQSGLLTGINVDGVTAKIADFEKNILEVTSTFKHQKPSDVTTLMLNSPLKDSVGSTLTQLVIHDLISGDFSLNLPLNDTEKSVATGSVIFENNDLTLKTPAMEFKQVNGSLHYNNSKISTENMVLNWRGMPLSLAVDADKVGDAYKTQISLDAHWKAPQWLAQLPDILHKYGNGELDWSGLLTLNFFDDDSMSYTMDIQSDLAKTDIIFPEPYRKKINEKIALVAQVNGVNNQSVINVSAGNELSFYGVLDHDKVQFIRTHIMLGEEDMLLPMDGFHITTKLGHIDFSQWQPFIFDIIDSIPEPTAVENVKLTPLPLVDFSNEPNDIQPLSKPQGALLSAPERIRGTIEHLDIYGQPFQQVSFNLLDKQQWWQLELNAKETRSEIKFYKEWEKEGVEVKADFIYLAQNTLTDEIESSPSETTEHNQIKHKIDTSFNNTLFENVPPIRLSCESCKVSSLDFGEVQLTLTKPETDIISVKNFTAKRKGFNVAADMQWQHNANISKTILTTDLKVKNVQNEMEALGFSSVIRDSGLVFNSSLDWLGGPHDFSLEHFNGKASSEISAGYLADVSDKGARIFSVLSLQSLVRKLTLDFRDMFSDGMFYSEMNGDFEIKDGVVYTNNTQMLGAAGDLSVKGNTRLYTGELDYYMSYKPNLTSSLPTIAWIATLNPVMFLGGIALDKVITSQVVSEIEFEVTGNINDPNLKEINRKSRDISVGRSTPPQFVEKSPAPADSQENIEPLPELLPDNLDLKNQDKSDG